MPNFEGRRLEREKRVEDHILAWKRELDDETVNTLSIEELIMILENCFSHQQQRESLATTSGNTKFITTFANICEENLKSVCDEEYGLSIGWFIKTIVSEKMPHCVEKIIENFLPDYFTCRSSSDTADLSLFKIDFSELVYEDFISPCENDLYNICHTAIIESEAINLIDDAIINNNIGWTFIYVINLACENIISLLEIEVPKTILNYFMDLYNQQLLSAVENVGDQVKTDIYEAFELSAIEITDCIYSEVDYPVSLTLASSVMIMYSNYEAMITDGNVNDLTADFAFLGV